MTQVPDGLPTLSAGPHVKGSGLACIMEYVSVLTGDVWTDYPKSTNEWIARIAQSVNDTVMDEDRHLLVPFIDRLASAGGTSPAFEKALLAMLPGRVRVEIANELDFTNRDAPSCVRLHIGYYAQSLAYSDNAASALLGDSLGYNPQPAIDFLAAVLDLHEQLVPHEVKPISPDALADARRLIETQALVV